jgi:Ca-activated chloride channel family protein
MRLLIPTTVSPRYVPRHQQGTIDPSELDHLAPPIGATVPYGLDLAVDLEAASDVAEVECPSHPARVRVQGRVVHVELSGQDVQLDRDFVLDVALARPHEAAAVVSRDALGDRYVQLTWFPDLSSAGRAPADYVFVLDRSGSMDGTSIESARKALLLAMRSLGEGDRFDVVGFGSSFERVFGKLVAYDDDTLQRATRTVTGWGADLGGTELLAVLQAVLSGDGGNGRVRQVLLLTDGEVSDGRAATRGCSPWASARACPSTWSGAWRGRRAASPSSCTPANGSSPR